MRAYFISKPRTYRDLLKPHLPEAEREYEIVKVIELSGIDYENFCEDMLVDREFIEDNAELCENGDALRCLLVKQRGKHEGILVVSELSSVKQAAYLAWDEAMS
jgi:hypothetical protein